MELGIQGRINQQPNQSITQQTALQLMQQGKTEASREAAIQAKREQHQVLSRWQNISREEIDKFIRKVLRDASVFNKDLRYSVNKETNMVIVKVVDLSTDKVIREIPPEALRRLQVRLKEQLGLLIDEKI
ncbi:MAG: flagellar protein FlaG [Spirochaetes bacterium]|nr:flagellar protein FlaG [Spirochaetota bacterium]